ncbi:MAG: DNA methyltransferase [Thermotogae bacterium]|nr:DNA methyltransferase [Thermotogota bacterium]
MFKDIITSYKSYKKGLLNIDSNEDTVSLRKDVLTSELNQILEARTLARAKYYLRRLKDGIIKVKTNKINDINLLRWKEYTEIITDSLWVLDKRDTSGAHLAWYWGNFIPQIPHQMMLRYTKREDWVLDTFVGSGTTLIECRRLGRNGIGIELNPEVAQRATDYVEKEYNEYGVTTEIITGDSRIIDVKTVLDKHRISHVQLLIMHPPYHDIIKFSKDDRDLSNAKNIEDFLKMFGDVVDNASPFLEKGRYFALVIGDKYSKGEWIPLGFYCMQEVLKRGYLLKSIIVKNFEETRGKRNQKELWRYRALVGGFYIFKHEYVILFKKR